MAVQHALNPSRTFLMPTAHSNILIGVALAVVATLSWALNFVAPYVTGAYSLYFYSTVVYPAGNYGKNNARAVRCVAE